MKTISAFAKTALLGATIVIATGASPLPHGSIELGFDQLRSNKGMLQLCLTQQRDHFPDCSGDPNARRTTIPATQDSVVFEGLATGNYAVAVIHDENANDRLDKFAGIPKEGFGFSRNPAIRMGPPKFREAVFPVDQGKARQRIRMRYML